MRGDSVWITADDGAAAPTDVGLIRYWGDSHPGSVVSGDRDETFGALGNGTVDSNLQLPSSQADDVVVTTDGSVIVAGRASIAGHENFILAGFTSDGRLATGAGITSFSNQSETPNAMPLQADGKIVVVGQAATLGSNPDIAIIRYAGSSTVFNPDGSFGTDGKLTIDFFGGRDNAAGVVQQPEGKLVVGGFVQNGQGVVFALARLMP